MELTESHPIRADRAAAAGAARQRQAGQPAGAERAAPHGRAGLQVARAAGALRTLAHGLHAAQPLVQASKRGVDRYLAEALAEAALDSTIIKLHPDGAGAPKKGAAGDQALARRLDDQAAPARAGRPRCADADALARPSRRRGGRPRARLAARRPAQAQPPSALGLRPCALPAAQSSRTALPPHRHPLRQAGRRLPRLHSPRPRLRRPHPWVDRP